MDDLSSNNQLNNPSNPSNNPSHKHGPQQKFSWSGGGGGQAQKKAPQPVKKRHPYREKDPS